MNKWKDEWRVVSVPKTEEEGQRIVEKAKSLIGSPFQHLPGNPPPHKVLAEIDGVKIRVEIVEMVWNDQWLIDEVYGQGHYRMDNADNPLQLKVLDLSEKLYKGIVDE